MLCGSFSKWKISVYNIMPLTCLHFFSNKIKVISVSKVTFCHMRVSPCRWSKNREEDSGEVLRMFTPKAFTHWD